MESLASSRLKAKKLDLYRSDEEKRCRLFDTELNDVEIRYPGLEECFAPMESLTMNLCNPTPPWPWIRPGRTSAEREATPDIPNESDFLGLGHLPKLAQHLSHLDIHYFSQAQWGRKSIVHSRVLMQHTAAYSALPNLQSCRIAGLHCDLEELLLFLQHTKPKRVTLENILALSGSWRPLFDFLTDPQTCVESSYLRELSEDYQHMWFHVPGSFECNHLGTPGSRTIERRKEDVRTPLDYGFIVEVSTLSELSFHRWYGRRLSEYGAAQFGEIERP
jgi:hypothetical protein